MSNLIDVIKYEGDNQTLVWKHPCEDFKTGTQLIVHETQEAVFFMNGRALDVFPTGKHTLETQNLPLLGGIFQLGKTNAFHCFIYFINLVEQMAIKWGTDSKVEYMDPEYNFPIQLGARGEMNLHIEHGKKFLMKVVGTENEISQDKLRVFFKGILMMRLKQYLAELLCENKICVFVIDKYLDKISEDVKNRLKDFFEDYGIVLDRFLVTGVVKPEDDANYKRFRDLFYKKYLLVEEAQLRQQVSVIEQETQAKRMDIESKALASKRQREGYSFQDEQNYDLIKHAMSNPGTECELTFDGLKELVPPSSASQNDGGLANDLSANQQNKCSKCGSILSDRALFCSRCGTPVTTEANTKMIQCPSCGKTVPLLSHCQACGVHFVYECPNCGGDIPIDASFCPKCGLKITV